MIDIMDIKRNGISKQITHKNMGNPLNIQCEADEDFSFSSNQISHILNMNNKDNDDYNKNNDLILKNHRNQNKML